MDYFNVNSNKPTLEVEQQLMCKIGDKRNHIIYEEIIGHYMRPNMLLVQFSSNIFKSESDHE